MKNTRSKLLAIASLCTALVFTSCDNDEVQDPNESNQGTANFSATDAAVDAENITGVFLKVKGIKVDAVDDANDAELMFNSTQEFNLMTYQNGETYDLGSMDLNAGSYSDISFILDGDNPAYVQYKDNTTSKIDFENSSNEYEVVGEFEITAESQTDLVADVDLRKALVKTSTEGEFMMRSTARLIEANASGTISGTISNYNEMKTDMEEREVEGKTVVFAYTKGSYSEAEKGDPDGLGVKGRFENAVNSAVVAEDGTFTLAFMNEADYEIVVASFEKSKTEPESKEYEFSSLIEAKLEAGASLDVLLEILGVEAQSTTNVSLELNVTS